MAVEPTDEEKARKILKIFKNRNCAAGDRLQQVLFHTEAKNVNLHSDAVNPGLKHAFQLGWLQQGADGIVILTQAGFDAM